MTGTFWVLPGSIQAEGSVSANDFQSFQLLRPHQQVTYASITKPTK